MFHGLLATCPLGWPSGWRLQVSREISEIGRFPENAILALLIQ